MAFEQWRVLLAYVVVCIAAGAACLRCTGLRKDALLHSWAGCYFAGQLLATVLVLSTGCLPWRLPMVVWTLIAIAGAGLVAIVMRARQGIEWRPGARLFAVALVLVVLPHLVLLVQTAPPLEWDARSIWMFHGKALFHHGGVAPEFFTDQRYWWSNLPYPLHVPAQAAINVQLLGRWDDQAARAFLLVDVLAFGTLLWPVLRRRLRSAVIATVGCVLFLVQEVPGGLPCEFLVSGQVDSHYAMSLALAILVVAPPFTPANWPLALLLAGRAAAIKEEGVVCVVGAVVGWAVLAAWRWWRSSPRPGLEALRSRVPAIAWAVTVLFLPTLSWGVWKATNGVTGGLHLGERLATPGLLWQLLAERSGTVLRTMAELAAPNRTFAVLIVWLSLLVADLVLRVRWTRHETLAGIAALGLLGGVFATYVLTPHDADYHMRTSAHRVLFAPHLLLCVLCLFRCEALLAVAAADAPATGFRRLLQRA